VVKASQYLRQNTAFFSEICLMKYHGWPPFCCGRRFIQDGGGVSDSVLVDSDDILAVLVARRGGIKVPTDGYHTTLPGDQSVHAVDSSCARGSPFFRP
jgi:hypothetical protein